MSAGHTPGPWLCSGTTVYALMHHGWRKGIEQFRNRFSCWVQADGECSKEEAKANALLIAAAPELLEALQMLMFDAKGVDVYESDESQTDLDDRVERGRTLARAAIAKATK